MYEEWNIANTKVSKITYDNFISRYNGFMHGFLNCWLFLYGDNSNSLTAYKKKSQGNIYFFDQIVRLESPCIHSQVGSIVSMIHLHVNSLTSLSSVRCG